jgi:DeoR/GlpR family transcriptional regulator of sugar metabolism
MRFGGSYADFSIMIEQSISLGAKRRREGLERLVNDQGGITVADAANRMGVSQMTIRRDLDALDALGRVRRVRGGAIVRVGRAHEPPLEDRAALATAAKARIARLAADLVGDGDTIILDVGSTGVELARALRGRSRLTVLTASVSVVSVLADEPGIRVIATGGLVRASEMSMVGAIAEGVFDNHNCDTLFLGVAGIDPVKGLTEFSLDDARVKQAAIRSARSVVVLADERKLGTVAFARISHFGAADVLICDAPPQHPVVRAAVEAGVRYLHAIEGEAVT